MPAKSKAQAIAAAIAEHAPSKLYARNQGLAKMTTSQQHEFAATPRKSLPRHVKKTPNRYGQIGKR